MIVGFIDLIFSNPLLLFIVIAAIINLFQRSSIDKKEDQRRKPPHRSPARTAREVEESPEIDWRDIFRQDSFPFGGWEQEPKKSQEQTVPEPKHIEVEPTFYVEEEMDKTNAKLLEKYERLKEKEKHIEETIHSLQSMDSIQQSEISSEKKQINKQRRSFIDFHKIDQDDLVKGIIWSEILNKPKSKSYR